jgi:hypothetical protein
MRAKWEDVMQASDCLYDGCACPRVFCQCVCSCAPQVQLYMCVSSAAHSLTTSMRI